MSKLDKPKNVKAAILLALLTGQDISEQDFRYNGFRARISDLKSAGLNIQHHDKTIKNSFGWDVTIRVHYLFSIDFPAARELYKKVNEYGPVRKIGQVSYVSQPLF